VKSLPPSLIILKKFVTYFNINIFKNYYLRTKKKFQEFKFRILSFISIMTPFIIEFMSALLIELILINFSAILNIICGNLHRNKGEYFPTTVFNDESGSHTSGTPIGNPTPGRLLHDSQVPFAHCPTFPLNWM